MGELLHLVVPLSPLSRFHIVVAAVVSSFAPQHLVAGVARVVSGSGATSFELPVARGAEIREESARGVACCAIGVAGASPAGCWRVLDVTMASPVPLSLAVIWSPHVRFKRGSARAGADLGRGSGSAREALCPFLIL